MDSDDFTPMAYATVVLARNAFPPLASLIGAAAGRFRTEDEFLRGVSGHLLRIRSAPAEFLRDWTDEVLDGPRLDTFDRQVEAIREHIHTTLATPATQRGQPPFASGVINNKLSTKSIDAL
jgi:hypothetical protein